MSALRWLLLGLLVVCGCDRPPPGQQNELVLLGTIRGQHFDSTRYSLAVLRDMIRAIRPSVVLCEIPPDRLDQALREFHQDGEVREPRVAQFPEYTEVLFPLAAELQFEIVPCAAWSPDLDTAREQGLAALAERDPQLYGDARDALDWLAHRLEREQSSDDPVAIHEPSYDATVREAMEAYAERVDADLGPAGWQANNRAHYALIDTALRSRAGRGGRYLLMFGAWHKYWLDERLQQRKDVRVRAVSEFWKP